MNPIARLNETLGSLAESRPSTAAAAAYAIALFFLAHQLLIYYDYPLLSPQEFLWNALVYLVPTRLLLDAVRRQELRSTGMLSQTYAAKSEALRKALGVGGSTIMQKVAGVDSSMRASSIFSGFRQAQPDAPPGLGNWDNSCYQNSVLQSLASLETVKTYLNPPCTKLEDETSTTSGALRELLAQLNDPSNNGKHLWTPAKLKSMSSWTQQDAQEYFSKIMDELDKEAAKSDPGAKGTAGLETAVEADKASSTDENDTVEKKEGEPCKIPSPRNPLEGLLAQRVACTRCGFSEGLSMIPFNCLTIPLGDEMTYSVEDCLDEYTKLEEISEVECAKCTLLKAQRHLQSCVQPTSEEAAVASAGSSKVFSLPPEIRALAAKRLEAVKHAIENDDFTDKTLSDTCQISKKAHVSSTKTKQAVIGRAPHSLVVHVNRSVFDERTGMQRKNHALVQYPLTLDLAPWILDHDVEDELTETSAASSVHSLLAESASNPKYLYRLRAVVTHYGRHENGHYIAYRQHPVVPKIQEPTSDDEDSQTSETAQEPTHQDVSLKWWRLSDDDVDTVSEQEVLRQGGVFMLFYERDDIPRTFPIDSVPVLATHEPSSDAQIVSLIAQEAAAAVPLPDAGDDELENREDSSQVLDLGAEQAHPTVSPMTSCVTSTPSTLEEDSEAMELEDQAVDAPPLVTLQKSPTAPIMRTARRSEAVRRVSKGENGFGGGSYRPMAAT